jgi:hypothetical protein
MNLSRFYDTGPRTFSALRSVLRPAKISLNFQPDPILNLNFWREKLETLQSMKFLQNRNFNFPEKALKHPEVCAILVGA